MYYITARSPVFTHLSTSLVGLTTVRAHKSEVVFQRVFDDYQDIHSSAWYMFLATSRWFGVWLDWMCVFYIGCVTYACVSLRESKDYTNICYLDNLLKIIFLQL